jgi:hypothetical protein
VAGIDEKLDKRWNKAQQVWVQDPTSSETLDQAWKRLFGVDRPKVRRISQHGTIAYYEAPDNRFFSIDLSGAAEIRTLKKWVKPNPDKGPQWERSSCQRLSLWVTNMLREDVFWRTSISGGRATFRSRRVDTNQAVRSRLLDNQQGDITAIHPDGQVLLDLFIIECKFWRDMEFAHLVFGKRGMFLPEWLKLQNSCNRHDRAMLFLAKQNMIGEVACVDKRGRDILMQGLDDPEELQLQAYFPVIGCYVYLFRDIITDVTFDAIRAYHAKTFKGYQEIVREAPVARERLVVRERLRDDLT